MDWLNVPLKVFGRAAVTWWDDWVNLAVIGLLWFLCTLTVLLAPPATFALFALSAELVRGASPSPRLFFEAIRRYFFKSWAWALVVLFTTSVFYANLLFYTRFEQGWVIGLQTFLAVLWLVWMGVQFYAVPFLMLQENPSLLLAWRNGLFTMLAAPGYSLILLLLALLVAVLCLALVLPLLLGGSFLVPVLGCQAVRERVETFQKIASKS